MLRTVATLLITVVVTFGATTYFERGQLADNATLRLLETQPSFSRLLQAVTLTRQYYVTSPNLKQMVEGAISGAVASLGDPYSIYFNVADYTAFNQQSIYYFTLRTLDDDRLVGYIGLSGILWNHGAAWLEMAVAPGEQGRGFGGDGLAAALRFAFGELNLRRVQLTVFSDNARAIALYEKMGFQREGAHREFLLRDGRPQDLVLYGLLRREWAK